MKKPKMLRPGRVPSRREQGQGRIPPGATHTLALSFLSVTTAVTLSLMRRVSLFWRGYYPAFMVLSVGILEVTNVYWLWSWWLKWALLLFGLVIMFSFQIGRRVHWSVGLLTASTLTSAVWGFHWYGNGAPSPIVLTAIPPKAELATAGAGLVDTIVKTLAIGQHGAIAAFCFLLVLVTFVELGRSSLQRLLWAFGILGHINSLVILYRVSQPHGPSDLGGLLGNPSVAACFSAVTLPLLCSRWWVAVPTLLAVGFTQTSMGVGVLAVTLSVWAASYFRQWVYALPLMGFFGLAGILTQGSQFLESSGRFSTWHLALDWFSVQNSWLFGVGLGQWAVFIPQAQKVAGVNPTELFTFAHQEFVQQFVECGLLGLASLCIVVGFVVHRTRHSPRILASVVGCIAFSLGNYPLRLALPASLIATLAAFAFTQVSGGEGTTHSGKRPPSS